MADPEPLSDAWFKKMHGCVFFSDVREPIPGCPGSFGIDEQPDPEGVIRRVAAAALMWAADIIDPSKPGGFYAGEIRAKAKDIEEGA